MAKHEPVEVRSVTRSISVCLCQYPQGLIWLRRKINKESNFESERKVVTDWSLLGIFRFWICPTIKAFVFFCLSVSGDLDALSFYTKEYLHWNSEYFYSNFRRLQVNTELWWTFRGFLLIWWDLLSLLFHKLKDSERHQSVELGFPPYLHHKLSNILAGRLLNFLLLTRS